MEQSEMLLRIADEGSTPSPATKKKTRKMKKNLLIVFALMCAVVQGAWAWEGSGTSTDPYLIKTSDDWKEFARSIRGYDFQGKHFRMTADIDADGAMVSGLS